MREKRGNVPLDWIKINTVIDLSIPVFRACVLREKCEKERDSRHYGLHLAHTGARVRTA